MSSYIQLSILDLVLASGLLLAAALASLLLQLGLTRQILWAAVRMTAQLLLIGLLLKLIFAITATWLTALVVVAMALLAGSEVRQRQANRLTGWWSYSLGASTMLLVGPLMTVLAVTAFVHPEPWYDPRYAIPMVGMILGNAMTGVSLGLDTLTSAMKRDVAAVEAKLLLGGTRWEACRPIVRKAMRSGMMPIINAMMATGVIALPGMMTGQILAGVDPQEAVRYQLLIMFMIAGATSLGVILAVVGGTWRLTDERHRLRLDRLTEAKAS